MKSEGDSEQVAHSPSTATTSQLCALFSLRSLLATTLLLLLLLLVAFPLFLFMSIPSYYSSIPGKKTREKTKKERVSLNSALI